MHIPPPDIAPCTPTSTTLLFHSRKTHDSYNGARHLPLSTWVRSPSLITFPETEDSEEAQVLAFEIVLFYGRNRACTIYRTWDDFVRLRNGLETWENRPDLGQPEDVTALDSFLREALAKRPNECAVEFFLRRRIEDCGGRS